MDLTDGGDLRHDKRPEILDVAGLEELRLIIYYRLCDVIECRLALHDRPDKKLTSLYFVANVFSFAGR